MHIDILTLFPQMFNDVFSYSIIGRARERHLVDIRLHDIRAYTHDKHHIVDDYPYGGGAGMLLKPEPIFEAAESIKEELGFSSVPTVLLSPQGRLFNQKIARQLADYQRLILICGHYEGVDERVIEHLVNDEISIGDYLLSGGEIAAMVVVDCVVRLLPGVVGSEVSLVEDSHTDGLLEYPNILDLRHTVVGLCRQFYFLETIVRLLAGDVSKACCELQSDALISLRKLCSLRKTRSY